MQVELFILRLSRDSGVLGLAGMAFASQLFSTYTNSFDEASNNYSILLVRPLLEFSKEDLYKVSAPFHVNVLKGYENYYSFLIRRQKLFF